MITRCRLAPGQKEGLTNLIQQLSKNTVMAEIGSYVGESTVMFAQHVSTVYAIDCWQNFYDRKDKSSSAYDMKLVEQSFDERTRDFPNIRKVKATSVEAAELFEYNSLDFVYIDANHTYNAVLQDIKAWISKIKPNGLIGGHGYVKKTIRFSQVIKAVRAFFNKKPDFIFEDTSWLIKLGE